MLRRRKWATDRWCDFLFRPISASAHIHPFNGPFSGTTRVSRYQKGKTNLDFTEARESEWQWHQLGRMQVCSSFQTDNHASTPPLSFLLPRCPSCRPTNSVKALTSGRSTVTDRPHRIAFRHYLANHSNTRAAYTDCCSVTAGRWHGPLIPSCPPVPQGLSPSPAWYTRPRAVTPSRARCRSALSSPQRYPCPRAPAVTRRAGPSAVRPRAPVAGPLCTSM